MTSIYLVRHGHTEVADDAIVAGSLDVALSKRGHKSLCLLKASCTVQFDRHYSSDLLRAKQTIEHLTDKPYSTDERLRELNFGDWEGLPWAEVHEKFPDQLHSWSKDWVNNRPPQGETFAEMAARCAAWLEEQRAFEGENILVTAHGGSIRALFCGALGLPLSVAMQFGVDHASVTRLDLHDSGDRCVFINASQLRNNTEDRH